MFENSPSFRVNFSLFARSILGTACLCCLQPLPWAVAETFTTGSLIVEVYAVLQTLVEAWRPPTFNNQDWDYKLQEVLRDTLRLKTSDAEIRSMLVTLGDPFTRIVSLRAGRCKFARAAESSSPRNGFRVRVGSQLRATGLSDGAPEGSGEVWCGLCGDRRGWHTCDRCMGEGGFPTRPGLAGVKGKVGWARCKTCFGRKVVPCLFCGISEAPGSAEAWARRCQATPPSKPHAVENLSFGAQFESDDGDSREKVPWKDYRVRS